MIRILSVTESNIIMKYFQLTFAMVSLVTVITNVIVVIVIIVKESANRNLRKVCYATITSIFMNAQLIISKSWDKQLIDAMVRDASVIMNVQAAFVKSPIVHRKN